MVISNAQELYQAELYANMSAPQFSENDQFLKIYDRDDGTEYTWEIEENNFRLHSIHPNRFSCKGSDFTGAIDLSEPNKKLFRQLGGENILLKELASLREVTVVTGIAKLR